jgi:hypothetical protein
LLARVGTEHPAVGFSQLRGQAVDDSPRNGVGHQERAVCGSERIHAEPRQLVPSKIPGASRIGPLRLYAGGVVFGLEQPQNAVYVREVRAVLL